MGSQGLMSFQFIGEREEGSTDDADHRVRNTIKIRAEPVYVDCPRI